MTGPLISDICVKFSVHLKLNWKYKGDYKQNDKQIWKI